MQLDVILGVYCNKTLKDSGLKVFSVSNLTLW